VGIGVGTVFCSIDLVGMNISISRGYNFEPVIPNQNLTVAT
jgi:hypothetical protein